MAGSAGTPGTPRVLRAMNDRAALDLLLEHGPLSRTRIGKLTGLSKPTASQLLARLESAGLVVATRPPAGPPGPQPKAFEVQRHIAEAQVLQGADKPAANLGIGKAREHGDGHFDAGQLSLVKTNATFTVAELVQMLLGGLDAGGPFGRDLDARGQAA
mgnify:CR=1 FL=1